MRKGKNSVPKMGQDPGQGKYQQKRLKSRAVNNLVTLYERDDRYYCNLCGHKSEAFVDRRGVTEHLISAHPVALATKMAELRPGGNL